MKEGWEVKSLGDVCDILDSKRKPITKRNRIPGNIPYYGATGVLSYVKDYLFDEQLVLLGEDGAKWESGDNSAFIINGKTWVNNHAHVLRPKRDILDDYWLVYNLNFQNLMPFISGMTVPKLNQGNMRKIQIPIPPLSDQKQIVALLDKAFAAIDQAQANIEKNMENAKELFQSKLNDIFSQKGEGWEEKSLGEICEKTKNIKWQEFTTEEFEYIDLSSVSRETLSVTETATVNKENAPSRAKKIIQNGDVIFATTRPTLRRATIIDEELSGNICSTGFVVLRPKQYLSSEWIFFFLLTSSFMSRMESLQRGASYPAVTDSDVKDSTLSVPISKEIEKRNIQIMNDIQEYSNNLISHYKQKLANLEDIKKSILQKAFAGELTQNALTV